jgi:hypothetical protein
LQPVGAVPRRLRHRDARNKALLARRHALLQKLLPDVRLPTAQEEIADPEAADQVYETCVSFLRHNTRDHQKFPLVFEELCNYGFRRNLWGMKPLGIVTSLVGIGSVVPFAVMDWLRLGVGPPPLVAAAALINSLVLLAWAVWFRRDWVRTAAEAYAERLLEALETLAAEKGRLP